MRLKLTVCLLLLAQPIMAEAIISPEEFEALSQNRTLYFDQHGRFYGKEHYFEGRVVTWKDNSGQCRAGRWTSENNEICFFYENDPNPHCWNFLQKSTGMAARLIGGDPANDLNLTAIDNDAVECPNPFIGT